MNASEKTEELYRERGKCARTIHDSGEKVIGYFCCFVPDEIITAFDMAEGDGMMTNPGSVPSAAPISRRRPGESRIQVRGRHR